MLPQYTFALGGTHKMKQLKDWLESHLSVEENLVKKLERKEAFSI